MPIGIALDIGTSGLRGQAVNCNQKGKILSTAVTRHHPLPGGNVIDHLEFAVRVGSRNAQQILIRAVNEVIDCLRLQTNEITRLSLCGNPIQLSIFQGIEIRDLAYAGQAKLDSLGVVPPNRDAKILKAREIENLNLAPDVDIIIPPAVHHEIGADTLAMLIQSGMMERDETAIATDYGTNAEMALKVGDVIYTASTAAGPALEGQQIESGMLALPGAICDISIDPIAKSLQTWVLDQNQNSVKGDMVDYLSGKVLNKGKFEGIGLTGTGVIALINEGLRTGVIQRPGIENPDRSIKLSTQISFGENDLLQAGRAIGAFRAGHVTLCKHADIDIKEIETAYMCGAAGTYVNVTRAQGLGLFPATVNKVYKSGNTSLAMARDLVWDDTNLLKMQEIADKLKMHHCMLATSKIFKNAYLLELSYWTEGMPLDHYHKFVKRYQFFNIPKQFTKPEVISPIRNDLGEVGAKGVSIVDLPEMSQGMTFKGCIGCLECAENCPENALVLDSSSGKDRFIIKYPLCYGLSCRKCEKSCPEKVFSYLGLITGKTEEPRTDD